MPTKPAAGNIVCHGMIGFDSVAGAYSSVSGSGNWSVRPIEWPGLPAPPPLGQVLVVFNKAVAGPYTVLVSASRTPDAPMLSCNYGNVTPQGFEVIIFNPVALLSYQTVRNGSFSFVVLQ